MAVATRHLHRRNQRGTGEDGRDDFRDDPVAARRRRPSQPSLRIAQSSAVLDALSDDSSELARFLRVGDGDDDDGGDNSGAPSSWWSRLRRRDATSLGSWEAGFLALALEPLKVRNERTVMLFEAHAIFGALFVQGTWIIYGEQIMYILWALKAYSSSSSHTILLSEWGSWKSFGGDGSNHVVERIFECIMAIALGGNLLLALWSAILWLHAIEDNSSHHDYAFLSVKPLVFLQHLLIGCAYLVMIGFLLAIYINLSPNWPETAVALTVMGAIYLSGFRMFYGFALQSTPLEVYHFPAGIKNTILAIGSGDRERLRSEAKLRAQELKKRAYRERKKLDPDFETSGGSESSIAAVLRLAAKNLGRTDCDVSAYETQLAGDWYTEAIHLNDVDADFLSRYMPHRLAKEVHKLVQPDQQADKALGN